MIINFVLQLKILKEIDLNFIDASVDIKFLIIAVNAKKMLSIKINIAIIAINYMVLFFSLHFFYFEENIE